jgi:hypothetical protein
VKEFSKIRVNFSLATVTLAILIILSIILVITYSLGNLSGKWSPIVGGAVVASVTALFQFTLSFLDYRNNERLSVAKVQKFLSSRDDRAYYTELVKNCGGRLDCLFFTAKRFCDDFCTDGGNDDLLIRMLHNSPELKVRIMIQERNLLSPDRARDFDSISEKIINLNERFSYRFLVKTYSHIPTHNIFMTEKDAVIGPYFYNKDGKYTHSIHFYKEASFVEDYREYFEYEWTNGKDYN